MLPFAWFFALLLLDDASDDRRGKWSLRSTHVPCSTLWLMGGNWKRDSFYRPSKTIIRSLYLGHLSDYVTSSPYTIAGSMYVALCATHSPGQPYLIVTVCNLLLDIRGLKGPLFLRWRNVMWCKQSVQALPCSVSIQDGPRTVAHGLLNF